MNRGAGTSAEEPKRVYPGRGINPVRSLWNHKFMAACIMILIAAAGAPVAWIKGAPKYRSECVVFVSPRFTRNLEQDPELDFQSNSQYREYVQQQVKTINRYDIILQSLDRLGPNRSYWQHEDESPRRAAERLQASLDISPIRDTYQIVVGLEDEHPDGLAETITAVVETFLETSKKEEFYASDRRLEDLRKEREKIVKEISNKVESRTQIAQDLGVTTFSEALPNPYDRLLEGSREALAQARRLRIEAEAQLSVIDPGTAPGTGDTARGMVRAQVATDPTLSSYVANLNLRRSELQSKIAGLTPEHPGRKAAEEELKSIDNEFLQQTSSLTQFYVKTLLSQRQAEASKAHHVERQLQLEMETQATQTQWYAARFHEALNLGWEIERARRRLDSVENRIDYLILESQAPGFVRMFSKARPPEIPFQGGRRKLLALCLVAAFMIGLLAPTAVDFLDPRIHGPGEAESALGFPPVVWLPEKSPTRRRVYEDHLIRLAGCMIRDAQTQGTRIFCLTSVHPGDGTTTLTLELAQKLTELGFPSLAVEANALHPDERYREDGHGHPGLKDVLASSALAPNAIVPASGSLPDRISLGENIEDAHLGEFRRIRDVLQYLATAYRFVILDAPPILASADAEFLAGVVPGTLLVLRAHILERQDLQRAARQLELANPGVAGAVLNRLQSAEFLSAAAPGGKKTSTLLSPWLWP